MRFQCEECLNNEYSEIVGSGEDDNGEFIDYECSECLHTNRVYNYDNGLSLCSTTTGLFLLPLTEIISFESE